MIGLIRNGWRNADSITVAKACTAFLIGVLIFAVLLSIAEAMPKATWLD